MYHLGAHSRTTQSRKNARFSVCIHGNICMCVGLSVCFLMLDDNLLCVVFTLGLCKYWCATNNENCKSVFSSAQFGYQFSGPLK